MLRKEGIKCQTKKKCNVITKDRERGTAAAAADNIVNIVGKIAAGNTDTGDTIIRKVWVKHTIMRDVVVDTAVR